MSKVGRVTDTKGYCSSVRDYIRNPKHTSDSSHRGLMRQPARVLFHCAKIAYGTLQGLQGARLPHSLQKTMFKEIGKIPEAAREGIVPLCEVDMWNPKESPESPHSGLMRQPTKEGIPEGERPSQGFCNVYKSTKPKH